ncbi:MAG TPA: hypothetical protein VGQ26_02830, partial [Streptosporangiaceae bacterium]|nr:hypothetical protein [Streptosporangiaceae bacterium]
MDRPAAPLTAYFLCVAVGRGEPLAETAAPRPGRAGSATPDRRWPRRPAAPGRPAARRSARAPGSRTPSRRACRG